MTSKGKTSGSRYNYSSRSHQSTSHSGKIQSFKIPKLPARNPAQEKRESSVGPANRVVKKYEKQRSSFILPPGVESQRLLNLKKQLKVTSAAALKKQRAMAAERSRAPKQDSESELEEQEVSDVEYVMEENARSRSETQKTKRRISSTSQSPEPQPKTRNRSTSESSSRSSTSKPRVRKRSISPKPRSRSPKSTKRRARKSRSRSAVRRPAPSTQARVSKKHTRSKSMERAYERNTERSRSSYSEEERERSPPPVKKTLKLKHTSPESRMIQEINALGEVACKMMESLKTEGNQAVRMKDFENDIKVFYNIAYPDKNLIPLNLNYPDLFKLLVEQYKKEKEELKQFEEACKLFHKSYATQPKEQPTHSDLLKTIKAATVKRFQKAKASETDYKQGHATYTATAAPGTSVSTSHQVQGSRPTTSSLCSTGEETEHETAANFLDLRDDKEKPVKKSKSKLSWDNLVLPTVSVLQKQRLELQRLDRSCRVEEDVRGIGASMSYNLPSLSRNTFVANTVSAPKSRTVFFLTFAKQELLTENHQLCLNEALVFKQHLFELFLFLTKYTGGGIYQIMLEPVVLQDQEEKLNPHLTYEMSTGVLFLFVLPRCKSLETLPFDVQLFNAKQQKVIAGAKKSNLPHVQNAADKAEKAMNSSAMENNTIEYRLNEDQTLGNAKHTLVKAIKKLICHNMGLITMKDLMLKGSGETLFPHINFATNYFKHTGASALPKKISFRQSAQQNFSFPKNFGVRYITEIAWRYFIYRDACLAKESATINDCNMNDDPLPGTCELCLARTLWRFHVSNMNGCPILQSFRRSTAEGALTRLLDGLADCEPDSTAFKLQGSSEIMIFKLETMELFPSQYRNVELPCLRPFTDD
ncbi:uncharacterized protein LOC120922493 [Rana temporaria]|uniref:uncharacterized protein LOC120922493 n=1 Tax=Rana temporaria TaxID=8407 RepID=UPI001AAC8FA8|nr:uncharacterized protein LOC120922493 [Rana temporaria]